jgi:hypothetical protein
MNRHKYITKRIFGMIIPAVATLALSSCGGDDPAGLEFETGPEGW